MSAEEIGLEDGVEAQGMDNAIGYLGFVSAITVEVQWSAAQQRLRNFDASDETVLPLEEWESEVADI